MSDEKKTFTVSDRRHFTAEGEARPDAPPDEPTPPPPAPDAVPQEDERQVGMAPDLSSLLLSLGAQASMLMGLAPDGEASEAPDIEGARGIISLLEVLQAKTQGNRTADEDRLLEGLLYELRMAFVERTRKGGA